MWKKYQFKINLRIRTYILILFAVLLGLIILPIIIFNSYISDKLLFDSATKNVRLSSLIMLNKIVDYFQPITNQTLITQEFIHEGIITPADNLAFRRYVVGLSKIEHVYTVFWADKDGTFYLVTYNRGSNELSNAVLYQASSGKKSIQRMLDREGNVLQSKFIPSIPFDARNRPWYQDVVKKNSQRWSEIFRPILFGSLLPKNREVLVVNSSVPVYNKQGAFLGVFGIAVDLTDLDAFLRTLVKGKKGAQVILLDHLGNVIAPNNLEWYRHRDALFSKVQNVTEIENPWVKASFRDYLDRYESVFQNDYHTTLFSFTYEGKHYIAFYTDLEKNVKQQWHLGVILPKAQVFAIQKRFIVFALSVTLFVFLVGAFFVLLLSRKVSGPITALAQDATRIVKDFNFEEKCTQAQTTIKEIILLQRAFEVMKKGLQSFTRYIPKALIDKIIKQEIVPKVGGVSQKITLLFADIQGFTTLSENIAPRHLMFFLSEYLEVMTKVIIKYNGTVDKYIGDAIMAFWGAPSHDEHHELHACQCAIELLSALNTLNQQWQAKGLPTIRLKIGIHTGKVLVGNVGSSDRLNYTAIGDSVNLTSRIESLNPYYKTHIIVTEATYVAVTRQCAFRLLDYVAVRGKHHPVYIYELLGLKTEENTPAQEKYDHLFREAFDNYQKGAWDDALLLFESLKRDYPEDFLIDLFINRCRNFNENSPTDWNGAWSMDTKYPS